jgi:DNA-binding NtrC family response regulator
MRFLVLDGSHLLISLIQRILDGQVDLEEVSTFDEALEALEQHPPEAVIANIGPDGLPWRQFQSVCQSHSPKIPVLFESCVFHSPEEAGLGPLNHSCFFIEKPYPASDLKEQLHRLVRYSESQSKAGKRSEV